MIDISGKDKAEVLARLYNAAKPLGMGILDFEEGDMPIEEAREMLATGHTFFDYVKGRVMKVNLSGDSFDPFMYDRDNGPDAARTALG